MPAVESKKRNSFLGSIALMLALPVLALNWFGFSGLPGVDVGPYRLRFETAAAVGVTGFAVLAALLAGRSRRTGTEIPVAAVLVGAVALGVGYFKHRAAASSAPAPAAGTPAQVAPVQPAAPAKTPAAPAAKQTTALPNASNIAGKAKSAAEAGTAAVVRQRNLATLAEARKRFEAARAAVVKGLESDPAYARAKAEAEAADAALKDARANYKPGDPNLVRASQEALAARDWVGRMIEAAVAKDAAATQAKLELDAAQAAVKR